MEIAPHSSRTVIAAVDDDADDVELMRLLFRKAGIQNPLQVFSRGEEVVAALSTLIRDPSPSLPLVCFIDVKMPMMNGHDVVRWIRGQPELDPMPVVMLSSSEHPADIERALENRAQCYLAKYPQPAVLQKVLAEAVRFVSGTPASECFRMPGNLLLSS